MTNTRFVLFSAARSGTSFLKETLGAHPEVQTFGEIFHDAPEAHLPAELRTDEQLRFRKEAPIGFAYRVLNAKPEKAAVGFKMWLDQSPEAAETLLEDVTIKKIILERVNKLATFTSGMAATQTGIWNVQTSGSNKYAPPLLSFRERAFDRHVQHHEGLFTYYRNNAVGEVLEVTYSELVANGFAKITRFLGVSNVALAPKTYRLLPNQMLERFEPADRPRVVAHMQKIGKMEWLDPE